MYQIQSDKLNYFEKEIKNPNRKIAYKFTLNGNDLPPNNIMDNPTLLTDLGLEQYSTGNVCVTSLQLSVKSEVALNYGDCITIHIGLYIYNDKTKKWEWLYSPIGSYYVDTIEEKGTTKSIKAYDAMCKLNKPYIPSGNHNKTYDLALDIANQSGLELKGISQDTNNYDIDGSELGSYTLLGALSLLVGAIGNHVRINREGTALEFFDSVNHGLVFNESHYLAPAMDNQTSYNITSLVVKYGDDDKKQYTVGNGDKFSTLTIENPLLNNQQAQATNILSKIEQLNGYKRFDTTILLADFRIDPLDIITYQFKNEQYVVPILYLKTVLTHTGIKHELQSPTVANKPDGFDFKGSISKRLENTYTKEETENTILDKGYQTEMQVQQTVDALQLKFTQSGGYNLIRNSTGYLETNSWTTTATMGTANDKSIGGACDKYMYLDNGTTTSERFAYSSRFNLKPSTTYTLTGWFHNYTKCPSFDVFVLSSTSVDSSDTGTSYTNVHHLINVQNTNGTWKKYTVSFTTPDDCKSGIIRIDNNGFNANGSGSNRVHWSALVLSEGSLEVPWSPHPNEISDGIVTADKDGITVSTSKGAYTRFSSEGMSSYNNSENQTLGIRNGGMTFYAYDNNEYVGYISQSVKATGSANGVSIGISPQGEYLSLGLSSVSDPNSGFAQSSKFVVARTTNTSESMTEGLNAYAHLDMHGWNLNNAHHVTSNGFRLKGGTSIHFDSEATHPSTIFEDISTGNLAVFGDNGVVLGYKNGDTNTNMFKITETADGKGCKINSYQHWNFNDWTMYNMQLTYNGFSRTNADSVTMFKSSSSSESNFCVELANDYVTYFNIQANNYADGGKYIARFHYWNGTSAGSQGIHFYRALNMHGYNITNVGNMNVLGLMSEEVVASDIKIASPYAVMSRSGEVESLSVVKSTDDMTEHNNTVTVVNGRAEVYLPIGLAHMGYLVHVTPNKLVKVAVTEKLDDRFVIEVDSDEEVEVDYCIKAFQPNYVTRVATYGELQGEESPQAITAEEAKEAGECDEVQYFDSVETLNYMGGDSLTVE